MSNSDLFVKMALQSWQMQISRTSQFLDGLSDEQLYQEIAPGKNRVIYIMGHLLAIHDAMNSILGIGQRRYAHLDAVFVQNPDKYGLEMPSVQEIRTSWQKVHEDLERSFAGIPAEDWFTRHNNMTDEDFQKEPARNKLAVLINRTNHAAYHLGQLLLIR